MLKKLLPILLIIVMITGCNESRDTTKYEDANFGITFNYPDHWVVTEKYGAPLWLIVSTTDYKPAEGLKGPGVMLFGFKPKDMELVNKWLGDAQTNYNNGAELTKSKASLGGLESIKYETEVFEEEGSKGKAIYYVIEEPEMSFMVQFPYSVDEVHKEDMKRIEDILQSIKFTKD
ncbi:MULTISPECIES: hypothetical protein [Paenibacillus]|uniref:hypothetical protein n=1 Tax=Paenibacillus TaxID=44249 RepID=UPI00096EC4B7|nr:hypothetical protein [Paenibacillus odorifer]OMD13664.1 hypothetical protein BJP50_23465 [Paenibacillus odorifer]OMD24703.1 hypothetical protein BJP48_25185 [Paenibacillus odorifer]